MERILFSVILSVGMVLSACIIYIASKQIPNLFKNKKFKNMKEEESKDDQVILTFFKGSDNRTIARNNKGKICLLDIQYCKANRIYVQNGEDWRCAIKEERANCIIVQPITRTLTAAENEEIYGSKLAGLRKKFGNKTEKK